MLIVRRLLRVVHDHKDGLPVLVPYLKSQRRPLRFVIESQLGAWFHVNHLNKPLACARQFELRDAFLVGPRVY